MKRYLRIDFSGNAPKWIQIRDGLRDYVTQGVLKRGFPVPPQKEVARALGVNPATVAKAYQSLIRAHVFVARRGDGTFVCEVLPSPEKRERRRVLRNGAMRFASLALSVEASVPESLGELMFAFRRLGLEKKGRHADEEAESQLPDNGYSSTEGA